MCVSHEGKKRCYAEHHIHMHFNIIIILYSIFQPLPVDLGHDVPALPIDSDMRFFPDSCFVSLFHVFFRALWTLHNNPQMYLMITAILKKIEIYLMFEKNPKFEKFRYSKNSG